MSSCFVDLPVGAAVPWAGRKSSNVIHAGRAAYYFSGKLCCTSFFIPLMAWWGRCRRTKLQRTPRFFLSPAAAFQTNLRLCGLEHMYF